MPRLTRVKLITLIGVISLILPSRASGYVNPQSGSTAVTATVPGEPDTPILISPSNNSIISTTSPSFIFSPSLGSVSVNHYDLWIDGAKNTSPIARSLETINTQAKAPLSEGVHTWFVAAVGDSGRTRNSVTWTFTVDTTAPLILVNKVAEHTTSLSSLYLDTFKNEVSFTTSDRYPPISGQGEAQAALSVTFSNALGSETVSTIIGGDRIFTVKPKTALRLGRYSVAVSSTDPAGNTTTLPAFYLDVIQATVPITIALPSPLPNLSFTIPVIVPPSLAELPTAFPLIPTEALVANYWLWLIILSYLCHIYCLNRLFSRLYLHHNIKSYHLVLIYITIIIPTIIMAYIAYNLRNWVPISLSLLSVFTLVFEFKLIQSKDIKIEQI